MSPLKKIIFIIAQTIAKKQREPTFIIAQNITKKAEKTHLVKYIFRTRSSTSPLFSFVYNNSSNVLYTFSLFFTTKAILSFA